ncbi:HIT domain-containing protein [Candidatus Woesearchaeota archaeon]|nr:HIT domain-containing protein [Candidatus Woesearchaeota archaeon]
MTDCDICKILENKQAFRLVHEDDKCFAILHESPAVPGHTLLIPKNHSPIFEEIPDDIISHLSEISNSISVKLFETLNAQGTNIIINNGIDAGQEMPHFLINIIPRKEGDGLNLQWEPKSVGQEELEKSLSMLKIFENIFSGEEYKRVTIKEEEPEETEEEEDYTVKQLHRIP